MNLDQNKNKKVQDPSIRKEVLKDEEKRPIIGITFLDKNRYGLKHLYEAHRGGNKCVAVLNDFLEKVRKYNSRSELIKKHASHIRFKNKDDVSLNKLARIQEEYDIEATDMCHLHCGAGGKGAFVLHGFFVRNCFEIIWLDVKHDLHK